MVFATPSAPSGEPCTPKVSALGEPKPIIVRAQISEGRSVSACAAVEGGADLVRVHAVDLLHMPADSAEAGRDVLREGEADGAGQGDLVLVVEIDQLAELEVTGERSGLGGDPFHQVAVGDDAVDVVIDDLVARAVEGRGQERSAIAMPTPLAKP